MIRNWLGSSFQDFAAEQDILASDRELYKGLKATVK